MVQRLVRNEPNQEFARRQLIKEKLDEVQGIYTSRVEELNGVKSRIDHFKECVSTLCARNVRWRLIPASLRMLGDAGRGEVEEQEVLEA